MTQKNRQTQLFTAPAEFRHDCGFRGPVTFHGPVHGLPVPPPPPPVVMPQLFVVEKISGTWTEIKPHPALELLPSPDRTVLVSVTGWYVMDKGFIFVVVGDTFRLPKKPSPQAVTGPWT